MFIQKTLAVFRKELTDSVRDHRSLLSAYSICLFGPVFIVLMMGTLAKSQKIDGSIAVPVVGAEHAPQLMAYLEQKGAEIVEPPEDPTQAVRDGEVAFVMVISEDYGDDWNALQPATVKFLHDSSSNKGRSRYRRVVSWIRDWSQQTAQFRLMARGVSPEITRPVNIEPVDFASTMARAAQLLSSLPMFFLIATFVCGMNVAIDTTAGERERGSLEALLTHATPTYALAAGKWLATAVLASVGVILMLAVSVVVVRPERFEGLGITVNFSPNVALAAFGVLLPLAVMVPALQMLVAIFAKNFKEAQTYLSLMTLLPMVPAMLLMFDAFDVEPWMQTVPVLGQIVQILDLIKGEALAMGLVLGGAATTLLIGVVLVGVVGHLLGRDRIVLAR